jgi:cell division cycle 14
MRIVRPGSVVGPQQQYMYLKQLEWSKWAAVDEIRKVQAATALTTTTLVTPATPPAEAGEEMEDTIQTTPTSVVAVGVTVPPVTPSKHIAAAQAKAKAIAPPGQPRKTPVQKRVAVDSDEEDEGADVLPALGVISRPKAKAPIRSTGPRATASEQRPTRVLRSTAGVTGKSATTTNRNGPNKIPRLATGTTTRNTAAAAARAATPSARRPPRAPPSPTPSRLPTLIPAKRSHNATNSLSEVASAATLKMVSATSDAWMTNNPSAVVIPGTKSERPVLRSVRRRRSSFSSADVVA